MGFTLNLGTLMVQIRANGSQFNTAMTRAQKTMRTAERNIGNAARKMSLAVTVPVVAMAALSVRSFASFDDAMTKSTAIMGDMSKDMRREMEITARTIAKESITSATNLAEAYFFLASAGLGAKQSIAALPRVEKFAVAGAFDMARATDLLTDAQSALGLTVKDSTENMENMTRVSDVLVKANTLANATVEQFSRALTTKAAASLRLLNKDMEEGVAVLAAFADQGVKGELAGERLSIVLRDLQNANIKHKKAWEETGLAVFDASGKMRGMADIIQDLSAKLKPMSDEQKKTTLSLLGFQERSISAIQTILGLSGKIREYESALRDAGGITEDVAEKQLKSFSSQMKILKNRINDVAIEIGQILAPVLLQLNEKIRDMIDWWQALDSQQKVVAGTIAVLVAAIGPLLISLALVLKLIRGIFILIVLINTPFVLLGIAIVALIGYLVGSDGLVSAWNSAKDAFENFTKEAPKLMKDLGGNWKLLVDWMGQVWDVMLNNLMNSFVDRTGAILMKARIFIKEATLQFRSRKGQEEALKSITQDYLDLQHYGNFTPDDIPELNLFSFSAKMAKQMKFAISIDEESAKEAGISLATPLEDSWKKIMEGSGPFTEKMKEKAKEIGESLATPLEEFWKKIREDTKSFSEKVQEKFVITQSSLPMQELIAKASEESVNKYIEDFEKMNLLDSDIYKDVAEKVAEQVTKASIATKEVVSQAIQTTSTEVVDILIDGFLDLIDRGDWINESLNDLYNMIRNDVAIVLSVQLNDIFDAVQELILRTVDGFNLLLNESRMSHGQQTFFQGLPEQPPSFDQLATDGVVSQNKQIEIINTMNPETTASASIEKADTVTTLVKTAVEDMAKRFKFAMSSFTQSISFAEVNARMNDQGNPNLDFRGINQPPSFDQLPTVEVVSPNFLSIEIINTMDPETIASAALSTPGGKQRVLNILGEGIRAGGTTRREFRFGS